MGQVGTRRGQARHPAQQSRWPQAKAHRVRSGGAAMQMQHSGAPSSDSPGGPGSWVGGRVGRGGASLIRRLASRAATDRGLSAPVECARWLELLAVSLQLSQAEVLLDG